MDQLSKILSVTNEELDKIDLSKYYEYALIKPDFAGYFMLPSGKEHYKLLAYISSLYTNAKILDIGTNYGYSAVCLADNKDNLVVTYDLVKYDIIDNLFKNPFNDNIVFKFGSFIGVEDLSTCPFICLDTAHDGPFEKAVINYLQFINWRGILLMDDILSHGPLIELWEELDMEKYEITSKGHWSGTGIVVFK